MSDKDEIIIKKIIKYLLEVDIYTKDMEFEDFSKDTRTLNATAFVLGQVGELSKHITDECKEFNTHINWKGIRGLRNRIVHDYENVDMNMLWSVVREDVPNLKNSLKELLGGI